MKLHHKTNIFFNFVQLFANCDSYKTQRKNNTIRIENIDNEETTAGLNARCLPTDTDGGSRPARWKTMGKQSESCESRQPEDCKNRHDAYAR